MMSPLLWIPVARQRECAPMSQSHAQNLSSNPHPSKGAFVVAPKRWRNAHLFSYPFVPSGDLGRQRCCGFLPAMSTETALDKFSAYKSLFGQTTAEWWLFFPWIEWRVSWEKNLATNENSLVLCGAFACGLCGVWERGTEREGGREMGGKEREGRKGRRERERRVGKQWEIELFLKNTTT